MYQDRVLLIYRQAKSQRERKKGMEGEREGKDIINGVNNRLWGVSTNAKGITFKRQQGITNRRNDERTQYGLNSFSDQNNNRQRITVMTLKKRVHLSPERDDQREGRDRMRRMEEWGLFFCETTSHDPHIWLFTPSESTPSHIWSVTPEPTYRRRRRARYICTKREGEMISIRLRGSR